MPIRNMRTWTDGTLVTATMLNEEIRDPINALTPGHQILTTTQRDALTSVATGTMIYNSTINVLQMWNGSAWVAVGTNVLASGSSGTISSGGATYDISLPAGFRKYTLEFWFTAIGGGPPGSVQILNGAATPNWLVVQQTLGSTYSQTIYAASSTIALPYKGTGPAAGGGTAQTLTIWNYGSTLYPTLEYSAANTTASRVFMAGSSQTTYSPTGIRYVSGLTIGSEAFTWRLAGDS